MKKQKQIQGVLAKTLAEAWENETFKKELVANPLDAIESLTGEKLNLKEGTKMVVIDQSEKDTFYFNIPRVPTNTENVELSEEQLEMVAGGGWKGALIGGAIGAIGGVGGAIGGAAIGSAIEDYFT